METKQKNCESTKKEMNSTKRIIGNTRQIPVKLGTEILDSVNDLENAMSDIGMRICKIVMNCQTEEEYALVTEGGLFWQRKFHRKLQLKNVKW